MSRTLAIFRKLDRHIYRRLGIGGRYALAEVTFLAFSPLLFGLLGPSGFLLGAIAAAALLGLLWWRVIFVMRLRIRAADHRYDASDKYDLAKEYWDTESATAARKRSRVA